MNTSRIAAVIFVLLADAMPVHAQTEDMTPWIKQNGCSSCHHKSNPMLGPSFKSMAAKHRADPRAAQVQFAKMLRTNFNHPRNNIDDDQLNKLTLWILQQ